MSEVVETVSKTPALMLKDLRDRISNLEKILEGVPGALMGPSAHEVEHVFTPGVYIRTIHIPAGMVIVGMIHGFEHWNIVQSGIVTVFSQDGLQTITGPHPMVSSAGIKRCVFAHTDTVWTTVHHNPKELRDVDELIDSITITDYKQLPNEVALAIERSFACQ